MFIKETIAIGALALCTTAGLASPVLSGSVDRSNYQIHIGLAGSLNPAGLSSVYSDLDAGPGGYVAFPDTAVDTDGDLESAGIADYTSISSGDILLDQFRFVGGVDQVGGTVFFDFFDSAGAFIDGFGITLNQAGNFIWTIDLATAITIAGDGLVQMSIDDENLSGSGSTAGGRWFLGNAGATIGNAGDAEAAPDFNYAFELNSSVPTPGVLSLLGLGGIAAGRRRR